MKILGICISLAGVTICLMGIRNHVYSGQRLNASSAPVQPQQGTANSARMQSQDGCGASALFCALLALGHAVFPEQVKNQLLHDNQNTSMLSLKTAAENLGLAVQAQRLDWSGLRKLEGVAILWVNKNHYIMADPRHKSLNDNSLLVFDSGFGSELRRSQIESMWSGETLVLKQKDSKKGASKEGPSAHLESLLVWTGDNAADQDRNLTIPVRNTGTRNLEIIDTKTSCGCTSAKATPSEVPPGGVANLEIVFNLQGERGPFVHNVYLKSNDPTSPNTMLVIAGLGTSDRLLSDEALEFGDIYPGSSTRRSVVLRDDGRRSLSEATVTSRIDVESPSAEAWSLPHVKASGVRINDHGDVRISVDLETDANCTPQPFKGTVAISYSMGGEARNTVVPFQGTILPPWRPEPSVVILDADSDRDPSSVTRQILLKPLSETTEISRDELQIAVEGVNATVNLEFDQYPVLISKFNAPFFGDGGQSGSILCRFDGGGVIRIPCIRVANPSGNQVP